MKLYTMSPGYCHQCDSVRWVISTYSLDVDIYILGIDFSYEQFILKFGHGRGLPVFLTEDNVKMDASQGIQYLLKQVYGREEGLPK